jgi:transposase
MRPLREPDRSQLERWARSRTSPYRLVTRARIVLSAATGSSRREIAERLRVRPTTVTRWLRRYALLGPQGLLRDAPRPVAWSRLDIATVREILWKTLREPPVRGRRWTTRSLAAATGVSHTTVRRVWQRFEVRSNMSRVSQLGRWPSDSAATVDVAGVFFDPPRWAVVFTTSPGAPVRFPPVRARVPDSPLTVPTGLPIGELMDRLDRRSRELARAPDRPWVDQEFLAFLGRVTRDHRPREKIHVVAGSGDHFSRSISRWLSAHPEISVRAAGGAEGIPRPDVPWMGSEGSGVPPSAALPSLSRLSSEFDSWFESSNPESELFAWVRG